jgi:hypothetical protein
MSQKTNETLPQIIARLHAEARQAKRSLSIEKVGGGIYFISGDTVTCHEDAVEFSDDEGVRVVVPYSQIIAIEVRRAP